MIFVCLVISLLFNLWILELRMRFGFVVVYLLLVGWGLLVVLFGGGWFALTVLVLVVGCLFESWLAGLLL